MAAEMAVDKQGDGDSSRRDIAGMQYQGKKNRCGMMRAAEDKDGSRYAVRRGRRW